MNRFLAFSLAALLALPVLAQESNANDVPFNGLLLDAMGNPVRSARIYVHSPQSYSRSDKHGRFGLTNVQPGDTIHIRFKRRQYDIPVEGRKSMRVRLADQLLVSDDQNLADLGYGYVKRREITTPQNRITGDDLRRTGQTQLLSALQGLVPGLFITTNARPGEEGRAVMRGINSLNVSTDPLFLVDGVVVSSLSFVNIYDVDYVEVMKDASIYGSRGSNGAILVHTKRGK